MSRVISAIKSANSVITVGSVDGALTAAAVKRLSGNPNLEVVFTQAFQVDRLPVGSWENRRVILVDLAVNNRNPEMTVRFVEQLREGGNTILAIIDEHSRKDWLGVLGGFDGLAVEPQTRDQADPATPQSSGEVLRRALVAEETPRARDLFDDHVVELLVAANEADQGRFLLPFARMVNQAVKSAIADNSRRVYLVKLLSQQMEADDQVNAWVAEYEEMEANQAYLLETAVEDLGDDIVRVDTGGVLIDITALLFALYKRARVVVITGATAYNPTAGRQMAMAYVATGDKTFDVLSSLKAAGLEAGGMPQKATIDPQDERKATAVIVRALVARDTGTVPVPRDVYEQVLVTLREHRDLIGVDWDTVMDRYDHITAETAQAIQNLEKAGA